MTELRYDPLNSDWVVIAIERAMRPENFSKKTIEEKKVKKCPFCINNESMTPPEVYALRTVKNRANSPGWKIRVVPNLYPAFKITQEANKNRELGNAYKSSLGIGLHEVIIHSPDHEKHLARLDIDQIKLILNTYILRYKSAAKYRPVEYISIIINHGQDAGASLEHPHSQLFAIPLIPEKIKREILNLKEYKDNFDQCMICYLSQFEIEKEERLIREWERFIVIAPYASKSPFEIMIIPKKHDSDLTLLNDKDISELAEVLKDLLAKLEDILDNPPYNLYIHNAPVKNKNLQYHWYIILRPKLTIPAGFEMSTNVNINVMKPEDSAKFLR